MVPISKKFLLKKQKYFIKKEEDENRYRWNLALKKYSDRYEEDENKAYLEKIKSKKDKKICKCW